MDDKASLRNQFLKLSVRRIILPKHTLFWQDFWRSSWTAFEIFNLNNLQAIRDHSLPNFVTLLRCLCEKVIKEARCDVENPKELINSIRLLSKLLPYAYESPFYHRIEYELFCKEAYDPFGVLALNNTAPSTVTEVHHQFSFGRTFLTALTELLFKEKFTLSLGYQASLPRVVLCEPGPSEAFELKEVNYVHISNRTEILRLLLALSSNPMYTNIPRVVSSGSRFLSTLVSGLPKDTFISMVFSLFNFMCQSGKQAQLSTEHEALFELRVSCLLFAGQLLALMISYPMPLSSEVDIKNQQRNLARVLFSRLSDDSEIQFVANNLLDIMRYPLKSNSLKDVTTSPIEPSPLCLSSIVILWELFQCNFLVRSITCGQNFPKLVTALLYHIHAFHDVSLHFHSVKVAAYFLLSLSGQNQFLNNFTAILPSGLIELFPSEFQLKLPVSLKEFVIIYICQVLKAIIPQVDGRSSQVSESLHNFLLSTLVDVLYNIISITYAAERETISPDRASMMANRKDEIGLLVVEGIMEVVKLFSLRSVLTGPSRNAELLAMILRAICSASFKSPESSSILLYSIIENESVFTAIATTLNQLQKNEGQVRFSNTWISESEESNDCVDANLDKGSLKEQDSIPSPIFSLGSPYLGLDESIAKENISSNKPQEGFLQFLLPNPPCGMSLKAKEKFSTSAPLSVTWGGNDALKIINRIIIPNLKVRLGECWTARFEHNFDPFYIATQIQHCDFEAVVEHSRKDIPYDFLPETNADLLRLSWNEISLGWYMSMIYLDIFKDVDLVRASMKKSNSVLGYISSSLSFFGKFTNSWIVSTPQIYQDWDQQLVELAKQTNSSPCLWRETLTKLFETQDSPGVFSSIGHRIGDTLASAVNFTNTLVRRLSGMRGNSRTSIASSGTNMEEIPERIKPVKRPSSNSIHSLNSLNRVRSYTPRNSFGA